MKGSLEELFGKPVKHADIPPQAEEEDLGPCAARAKDKWVTCLHVYDRALPVVTLFYAHVGVMGEFRDTEFTIPFGNGDDKYVLIVRGRNLWKCYNLACQHRLEWIRVADRDFARDGELIITGVRVKPVEERKREED